MLHKFHSCRIYLRATVLLNCDLLPIMLLNSELCVSVTEITSLFPVSVIAVYHVCPMSLSFVQHVCFLSVCLQLRVETTYQIFLKILPKMYLP